MPKRSGNIPYKALERAKQQGEEDFPDADKIVPLLHNGEVYIEVWKDGYAKNVTMDPHPVS